MPTSQNRPAAVLLLLVIGGILIANVLATYNLLTRPYPGHNDFMSRWEGARSFFVDGLSPYSEQTSLNIQTRIYGRAVTGNEDPGLFVYPFYTAFLLLPLVWLDYAWASAIWMVLLEVCLVAVLLLLVNLFRWQPRPGPALFFVLVLWALGDYYAARGLLLGQPSHVVYLLQMLALWALWRGYDAGGGVALALSTFKPQMGYLLVPFLLLYALRERRWRFAAGFGITFGLLLGLSFLAEPTWLVDWLAQVRAYPEYTAAAYDYTGSPTWLLTRYYLGLGAGTDVVLALLFHALLFWGWFQTLRQPNGGRLLWAAALTLTITQLGLFQTATPHYVVFTLPLMYYLWWLHQGKAKQPGRRTVVIIAGLFALTWLQFALTVRSGVEAPSMYLPMPYLYVVLLVVTRRLWWTIAPQRDSDKQQTRPAAQIAGQ